MHISLVPPLFTYDAQHSADFSWCRRYLFLSLRPLATVVVSLSAFSLPVFRDGHFRISNLQNPNPDNIGPESGSFIGLLSPKIFLAIIGYYVNIDEYC